MFMWIMSSLFTCSAYLSGDIDLYHRSRKESTCTVQSSIVSDSNTNVEEVQDPEPLPTDQPSTQVATRPAKLTLVTTLDLVKTEGDKDSPWVTGLDFLSDGRIAAVDRDNRKCFIMNASLQRQGSAYKFRDHPLDVTCYGGSKLAVTLGYAQEMKLNIVTETLCTSFCHGAHKLDLSTLFTTFFL